MIDRYKWFMWATIIMFAALLLAVIAEAITAAMVDGSKWFAVVMMVVFSIGWMVGVLVFRKDML